MAEIQNPLGKFATYNNLWTMYTTTTANFNGGGYRDVLENVILSSAGRYSDLRVQTLYGSPEFFINNIEMKTMIQPNSKSGNSIQTVITFDVFEPYSMGLFMQSCQAAAKNAGYENYLNDSPYVLKLEIQGQTTYSEFETLGPWYFCFKFTEMSFTSNESGSSYSVVTMPYNDVGFNSTVNTLHSDVKVVGESAYETLIGSPTNSIIEQLNLREMDKVKKGKAQFQDYYSIDFVKPDGDGENVYADSANDGNFDFQADTKGGTEEFKRAQDVYENDKVLREKVSIDPKKKTLSFSSSTSITGAIDAVLLMTRHARETGAGLRPPDAEGNYVWWRIDVDIKLLQYDEIRGEHAKIYLYRIVPFKIHSSAFQSPGSAAQGIPALTDSVAKRYYYLYTGLNTEVLKWDLKFENLFYRVLGANPPESTGIQTNPGSNVSVAGDIVTVKSPPGAVNENSPEGMASRSAPSPQSSVNPHAGGAGVKDTIQKIADEFYHAALTHSTDMVNLDLEVQGDPYWLPESGQPNFHSPGGGTMISENGTMNYENRDIMIEMIFRTPYDTEGGTGLYKFMYAGQASPFGGIYKVTEVINHWKDNHFTCNIQGIRIPAQLSTSAKDPHPYMIDEPKPEPSYLGEN